jgi:hypothetical protein
MRKLLLSSLTLLIFCSSILIFQASCKKEAAAQNTETGLTQLKKVLWTRLVATGVEIWMANYDGTNANQVNVIMPTGFTIRHGARLSPDGQKLFFVAQDITGTEFYIFSSNVNGSNAVQIANTGNYPDTFIEGAY